MRGHSQQRPYDQPYTIMALYILMHFVMVRSAHIAVEGNVLDPGLGKGSLPYDLGFHGDTVDGRQLSLK